MTSPAWTPAGTLLLPIAADTWPPPACRVVLDGIDFAPKRELHVTLVGRALGQALRTAIAEGRFAPAVVRAAVEALDWRFERTGQLWRLEDTARRGTKPPRGSIIETVEMPAMAAFHARLGGMLGRRLPVPPAHVTLYTSGDDAGIGVPDDAALRRLAVRAVSARELPANR